MRQKHKQNKDAVIKMLIDNIFTVDLSLPPSIIQKKMEDIKRKKDDDE